MEVFQIAVEVWPRILLQDALRYFMFVVPAFGIVWVWKGREWRHRRVQIRAPRREVLWREARYSLLTIIIFSIVGTAIFAAKASGLTAIYDDVRSLGWAYLLVSPVLLIILHDAYFYWSHRLMHTRGVFRLVHAVHHRSASPSPWAAYSFHPFEAIIQAAFYPVVLFLIPFHPMALLVFVTFMIVRNVWGHLGFELLPRGFLEYSWVNWNTTTTHHDLHHSTSHANYGLYFTWWDRWMKTEHALYRETFNAVTSRVRNTGRISETLDGSSGDAGPKRGASEAGWSL